MFAFSIYSGTFGLNKGILPLTPRPPINAFTIVKTERSSSCKDSQKRKDTRPFEDQSIWAFSPGTLKVNLWVPSLEKLSAWNISVLAKKKKS